MKINYHNIIKENEIEINRIHKRVHSTYALKYKSDKHMAEWSNACDELHKRYAELAYFEYPIDFRAELRNGNQETIERALAFIEIRPFHFRSGYIFKDLMRVMKNIEFTKTQKRRYDSVNKRFQEYRNSRKNQI